MHSNRTETPRNTASTRWKAWKRQLITRTSHVRIISSDKEERRKCSWKSEAPLLPYSPRVTRNPVFHPSGLHPNARCSVARFIESSLGRCNGTRNARRCCASPYVSSPPARLSPTSLRAHLHARHAGDRFPSKQTHDNGTQPDPPLSRIPPRFFQQPSPRPTSPVQIYEAGHAEFLNYSTVKFGGEQVVYYPAPGAGSQPWKNSGGKSKREFSVWKGKISFFFLKIG